MNNFTNNIIRLEEIDSTNTYLKELSKNGVETGTVVISKTQSNGRGRLGKSFTSLNGGIYLSYLMRPDTIPEITAEITMCTAVIVRNVIIKECNFEPDIKYVNDLTYKRKKFCGILTELVENNLIIGIGINVNQEFSEFPENLKDIVTTVKEITGKEHNIDDMILSLINGLNNLKDSWPACKDDLLNDYKKHMYIAEYK